MVYVLTILAVLTAGCLRSSAPCGEDSDCFKDEVCAESVCSPPSSGPEAGPIEIKTDANHSGSVLEFDDNGFPELVSYYDDGSWFYTRWAGERWSSKEIISEQITDPLNQTQLIRDSAGNLHFTFLDRDASLHLVSQNGSDWNDEIVVESAADGSPFGNSIASGRSGQIGLCYIVGNFPAIRMGAETGKAYFAKRDRGEWTHHELPSIDGASPTFGCALSMDPDSSVGRVNMTFVRPDTSQFSRTASSFTEPVDVLDFSWEPVYMDGRIPSAKSSAFDANVPSVIAYARLVLETGEVLQLMTDDDGWRTVEILEAGPGRTISEVNLHPDLNSPERTFFFVSTQTPVEFHIGWVTPTLTSIEKIDFPAETKSVIAAPDRDGRFHIVFSDGDGIQYRTQNVDRGEPR